MNGEQVIPADFSFKDGTAFSANFDDYYFSRHGGKQETQHVFIKGNSLPQAWQGRDTFCIGETGFGTGLNFFETLKVWEETTDTGQLEFISAEKHPLTKDQMQQFWQDTDISALLAQYPPLVAGFHRLFFPKHRATLTLIFGDATEAFKQINAQVNCWLLDGFTPAKNEELWTADLFGEIKRLSAAGATFATFTAASSVRTGLTDIGFTVEKQQGFKFKRDMLTGHLPGKSTAKPAPKTVTVVGGGIAGCATARALAEKGIQVDLYEKNACLAAGVSSNPAAVVYPRLTAKPSVEGEFYAQSYLQALRILTPYSAFQQTGVFQQAHSDDKAKRQAGIIENLGLTDDIIHQQDGGILFPQGGWVNLADLCQQLVDHPSITIHLNTPAPGTKGVQVICTNYDGLALQPVAGQILSVKVKDPTTLPKTVVTYDGYCIPNGNRVLLGSTYHRDQTTVPNEQDATEQILEKTKTYLPDVYDNLDLADIQSWQGARGATAQRFPIFGQSPENADVYYNTGHGSHAATSALYCAALISGQILGHSLPAAPYALSQKVLSYLSPKE